MREDQKLHDRLGIYLGKIREYEKITRAQLAEGLCSEAQLARIESGEREADKLLTDALLQRMGKPADLFMRLLDEAEVQDYRKRNQILHSIQMGERERAVEQLMQYRKGKKGKLEDQFIRIVELNLDYLRGVAEEELRERIREALLLTQPRYGQISLSRLLLSRNEGCLLLAYLKLKEKQMGEEAVAEEWQALLEYFRQPRYEQGERIYLYPCVACHVAEQQYQKGNLMEAMLLCEQGIKELQEEEKLYYYRELLLLKQKIADALGWKDEIAGKLAEYLQEIQDIYGEAGNELWIPYVEGDDVHSIGQAVAERRQLLGMSQEELAFGICDTSTVSRIENRKSIVQKSIRTQLLQRVNLSGERYDYEVITENYEDYLLRSQLGRAINDDAWDQAEKLLAELRSHISETKTNYQYLEMAESCIREQLPEGRDDKKTLEERIECLWQELRITLPSFPQEKKQIENCPAITLSINEIVILKQLASGYYRQENAEMGLAILFYLKKCMERVELHRELDVDAYTLCMRTLVSILGDVGRYEESDEMALECLRLVLGKKQSKQVASFLYDIAWNGEKKNAGKSERNIAILKSAYAYVLLSRDKRGQQHIEKYSKKIYGIEMGL